MYQNFLSQNFPILVVKFSIYLNRCVFLVDLMLCTARVDVPISLDHTVSHVIL